MPKRIITQSYLQTYDLCPQKAYLKYIQGWRYKLASKDALRFGAAIHEALEKYWRFNKSPDIAIKAGEKYLKKEYIEYRDIPIERQIKELVDLKCMVEHWTQRFDNKDLQLYSYGGTYRFAEVTLRKPLDENNLFQGKIDAVIENLEDGTLHLWELKTCSGSLLERADLLAEEPQIHGYASMLSYNGIEVDSSIVDILRKPLTKPKKVKLEGIKDETESYTDKVRLNIETKVKGEKYKIGERKGKWKTEPNENAYCYRKVIKRDIAKEDEFTEAARQFIKRLDEDEERGYCIHTKGNKCISQYGRPCDMLPLCHKDEKENYKRQEEKHSELGKVFSEQMIKKYSKFLKTKEQIIEMLQDNTIPDEEIFERLYKVTE